MTAQRRFSDEIGHRTVTDASVMTFGCLTGDYSRMHFDLAFGGTVGMGGPIAHGLLSAAWSIGAMTLHAPERLGVGRAEAHLAAFEIRFTRMVHVGDRFSLRWSPGEDPSGGSEKPRESSTLDTDFEVLNQHDEVTCAGTLGVRLASGDGGSESDAPQLPTAPEPMSFDPWSAARLTEPLYAEDMKTHGPRGVSAGRTLTEADVVAYTSFTGELNPLFLNAELARSGPFGARIAPPMLTFCLGFGDYLRDLLRAPMPSTGFAGHLGDSWRCFAPVHIGDTVRVRHKPVAWNASKSRPGMAIVEFALQLENQRNQIVQDGRVTMMMATREES